MLASECSEVHLKFGHHRRRKGHCPPSRLGFRRCFVQAVLDLDQVVGDAQAPFRRSRSLCRSPAASLMRSVAYAITSTVVKGSESRLGT
jgi:hypothetical protein